MLVQILLFKHMCDTHIFFFQFPLTVDTKLTVLKSTTQNGTRSHTEELATQHSSGSRQWHVKNIYTARDVIHASLMATILLRPLLMEEVRLSVSGGAIVEVPDQGNNTNELVFYSNGSIQPWEELQSVSARVCDELKLKGGAYL